MEASGNLKRCRGKTLPVKVRPTANAQCILEKGVRKHVNHDKKVHEGLEYVLRYSDHSEVVNLPGTTNEFILVEYVSSVSVLACTGHTGLHFVRGRSFLMHGTFHLCENAGFEIDVVV